MIILAVLRCSKIKRRNGRNEKETDLLLNHFLTPHKKRAGLQCSI